MGGKITMKIGIVGLGLIGGSLAWDFTQAGHEVWGVSRRSATCEAAQNRGLVVAASDQLTLLESTDIIFICTPISLIVPTAEQLFSWLPQSTVVTDVGSVKGPIVAHLGDRWRRFVGGHPMAGTAEQGLEAAQPRLFHGAPYVLTPTAHTDPQAIALVKELIQTLGAQLHLCDPAHHDRAVAWISHGPVWISATLIASCLQEEDPAVLHLAQQLASSGFRDTSRVGGGNPELGVMMAQHNQTALLRQLKQYRDRLDGVIQQLETNQWEALETMLHQTQAQRPAFLRED